MHVAAVVGQSSEKLRAIPVKLLTTASNLIITTAYRSGAPSQPRISSVSSSSLAFKKRTRYESKVHFMKHTVFIFNHYKNNNVLSNIGSNLKVCILQPYVALSAIKNQRPPSSFQNQSVGQQQHAGLHLRQCDPQKWDRPFGAACGPRSRLLSRVVRQQGSIQKSFTNDND